MPDISQLQQVVAELNTNLNLQMAGYASDAPKDDPTSEIERLRGDAIFLAGSIIGGMNRIRNLLSDPRTRNQGFQGYADYRHAVAYLEANLSAIYGDSPKSREVYAAIQLYKREFNRHREEASEYALEQQEAQQQAAQQAAQHAAQQAAPREPMGLASRGKGMCGRYLDWLAAQPKHIQLAYQQFHSLFGCTEAGIKAWEEERRRRDEEARKKWKEWEEQQQREGAALQRLRVGCHPVPAWMEDRILDNPQRTTQSGPNGPLAVPFTVEEVQTAVRNVVREADRLLAMAGNPDVYPDLRPSCAPNVSATDVRIAEFVSRQITQAHQGHGWARITISRGRRRPNVREVYLPRSVELMFGNFKLSEPTLRNKRALFNFDAFMTTYTIQLRNERAPQRPTFAPQDPFALLTKDQQRHLWQIAQQQSLEEMRRHEAGPPSDAPGHLGVLPTHPSTEAARPVPPQPVPSAYLLSGDPVWTAPYRRGGLAV